MPFLHITTRIDDHPYDGLLREKGFGGFPSLAFLDAEGEVVGQPRDRSVAAFAGARDALMAIDEVAARVEAGDEAAEVELLFLEFELGRVEGEAFDTRAAALRERMTDEQRARVDGIQLDAEAWGLVLEAYQGDREAALTSLLAMFRGGRMPTAGSRADGYVWNLLGDHARSTADSRLLRELVAALRARGGDAELADGLEETATGLDERDALTARAEAGEAGLEAKILLIEARLDAVTLASFRERLDAALAAADEAETAELHQAHVDLEASTVVDEFWGGGDQPTLGARLLELLLAEEGPRPSEDMIGLVATPVFNWSWFHLEPATILANADALEAAWGADGAMADVIAELRKMAAEKAPADEEGEG